MAKNRVNQSAAIRFGPALKALLLCVMIGGSGIGYVWQKKQIMDLSQQIGRLEQQRDRLKRDNDKRRRQLDELHLPGNLERSARNLNLGLLPPRVDQVIHLPEPQPDTTTAPPTQKTYAAVP